MLIMALLSCLDGLGGIHHGSLYKASPNIDLEKKPGQTRIRARPFWSEQLFDYLTATYFVYSPHLIWFCIALVQWVVFPYDISGNKVLSKQIMERVALHVVVVLCYYGFWHVSIAWWCNRPFAEKQQRSLWNQKVFHNVFYTTLGAIQWGLTEGAFIHGYSSGRLFQPADDAISIPWLIVVWILLVPIVRDIHFYFAHRFMHIRFVYKYIHSVHHRNTDVEPFSGMCMHPIEHFYYFTCYGPLLWVSSINPFIVAWMGTHVTLSPAASHSGYEDHWSADLYHYLHHRYYECNYGPSEPFFILEQRLGTFRDCLEPGAIVSTDPKATLVGIPEGKLYFMLGVLVPSACLANVLRNGVGENCDYRVVSALFASAPLLAAALLHAFSIRRGTTSIWKHYMAPFHKDTLPSLVIHSAIGGVVCCILPAYSLIAMLLRDNE